MWDHPGRVVRHAPLIAASFAAAALTLGSAPARAESRPEFSIPHVEKGPVLDALDHDEAWAKGADLSDFSVFMPHPGLEPRFSPRGKILKDRNAIYLWVEVDIGAADLFAPMAQRDKPQDGDSLELQLDPQGLGRQVYVFGVSAAGVLYDGIRKAGEKPWQIDRSWDSLFDARTRIEDDRWVAEIRIPFLSLRFDPEVSTWGMHLMVGSWRHEQMLSWAPIDLDIQNRLVQAGRIHGLVDLESGRTIELLPSLTLDWSRLGSVSPACTGDVAPGAFTVCGAKLRYGLGFKWAASSSTTVDLVANPDFSQIEADAPQLTVNNRFALHLAERRPFFLEGKDIFDLPFELFYSRSIDDPEFAMKVTHVGSRVRAGVLYARDVSPPGSVADSEFSPRGEDGTSGLKGTTAVARAQWEVSPHTSVGVVAIDRALIRPSKGRYVEGSPRDAQNQVLGIDARSELTGQLRAELAGYVSHADSLAGARLDGHALHGKLSFEEYTWRLESHYQRISEDFRSEAGYLPRLGFHNTWVKLDGFFRSENPWRKLVSPGVWANVFFDEELTVSERELGVNMFWMFAHHVFVIPFYKRVAERVDGRWLDMDQFIVWFQIQSWRWIQFYGGLNMGGMVIRDDLLDEGQASYVGWQTNPSIGVILRPHTSLKTTLSYEQRVISSRYGGDHLSSEPIARAATRWFLSHRLNLRHILEWDALDEFVANDLLLSYEHSPGTVIYLGLREETTLDAEVSAGSRSVFAKVSLLSAL